MFHQIDIILIINLNIILYYVLLKKNLNILLILSHFTNYKILCI